MRFLAALLVFLEHAAMFKKALNPSLDVFAASLFVHIGEYGVGFFFVLSGFLINYLLFKEVEATQKLNVKNFYIRRLLRIWPLYFLVGIGGTLLGPVILNALGISFGNDYVSNLAFLFLFAINIQLIFFEYNRGIVEILWSVCIEEQFYLLWAPVVKFLRKYIVLIALFLMGLGFCTPFIFEYLIEQYNLHLNRPNYFFTSNSFIFFGMGILGSCVLFKNKNLLQTFIFKKGFQIIGIGILLILILNRLPLRESLGISVFHTILALFFVHLILSAIAPNSVVRLERPFLNYLGKISYGIYVYHTFVLQIVLRLMYKFFSKTNVLLMYEFVFPLLGLAITVLISHLSFKYFESFFLRIKKKYAPKSLRNDEEHKDTNLRPIAANTPHPPI